MNTINVLDHGFVKLRNLSGPVRRDIIGDVTNADTVHVNDIARFDADDTDPAITARISFDNLDAERTREQDLKLYEYLMANHHCYYETMQVLTVEGWRYWKDLGDSASFLVPNPLDKSLSVERLPIVSYNIYDEELFCFKSKKMEYKVTSGHSVYVKGKYEKDFTKQKVADVTNWGNHEQACKYSLYPYEGEKDTIFSLVGFFLGDGSFSSKNIVNFHLKKQRKIDYLVSLLEVLNIPYTKKQDTYNNSVNIFFTCPAWLLNLVDTSFECKYKKLADGILQQLKEIEVRGLFDGLVNSDGHIATDRNRIEFTSVSTHLIELFETLGTFLGLECHKVASKTDLIRINARLKPEKLARRVDYLIKEQHTGKTYCTTTSTGLLVVRGSEYSDSYICGNSTPVEMIEIWLEMKLPIFIARQFVRHRTATINEVSARYATLPEEWYIPEVVGGKAVSNKQGQTDTLHESSQSWFRGVLDAQCAESYKYYKRAIDEFGIAPEHARMFLHVNHYTHWIWKQDLSNMMHFLSLRLDSHAQVEARLYAQAIYDLLKQYLPKSIELFDKYRRL